MLRLRPGRFLFKANLCCLSKRVVRLTSVLTLLWGAAPLPAVEKIKAAVEAAEKAHGPIDLLICNAGMCKPGDERPMPFYEHKLVGSQDRPVLATYTPVPFPLSNALQDTSLNSRSRTLSTR